MTRGCYAAAVNALEEALTQMQIDRSERRVVIPPETELEDCWWQFDHKWKPVRIVECEKPDLLIVISSLMKELEQKK